MTPIIYRIEHNETGETHEGTANELAEIIHVGSTTINKMSIQGKPISKHWMVTKYDKYKIIYTEETKWFLPPYHKQSCVKAWRKLPPFPII